jgi:hypothetical protein
LNRQWAGSQACYETKDPDRYKGYKAKNNVFMVNFLQVVMFGELNDTTATKEGS